MSATIIMSMTALLSSPRPTPILMQSVVGYVPPPEDNEENNDVAY